MKRYVIAGAGAAGISAAEAIRSLDPTGEIILIHMEAEGYYSRPGLAYYLTGEIPEEQLYPFQERDFQRLRAQRLTAQVTGIDPQAHRLQLHTGKTLHYDRLLIAVGATAMGISTPGVNLEGVVKLDTLQEARSILKQARKARSAVVVGGGITALEIVEGLRKRGLKTHYFLRKDRYWPNVLDETESHLVEGLLKKEGVHIHYNTELAEILGKNGRVCGVRTEDGQEIACQIVGVAVGIQPRLALAQAAGLKIDRGILVDQYLRSSAADIYAAGDVAEVFDPTVGKPILDSLWGPAVQQGRTAGLNMAGQEQPYAKATAFNVTRLAGLTTTIIGLIGSRVVDADTVGIVRGDSEAWRQLPDAIVAQADFEVNRLRILVAESNLVGAIIMGDQTLSRPLQHLISRLVDITPIREALLRPKDALPDILAGFWSQWSRSHARP
jgi:NADPH-dependent 2,4-dienoyl-CoA reductase/sulfur reductase-like enzyme